MANDAHDNAVDDKAILGKALRGELNHRETSMIGYSSETKQLIARACALDPALEGTILAIAESAYADGQDAASFS